jgi:hypothetical protein
MKTFFKWFGQAFAGNDNVSIKRITGFLIILVIISIIYFTGFELIPLYIWIKIQPFLETLIWVVLLLFGINAGIDLVKIIKKTPPDPPLPKNTIP